MARRAIALGFFLFTASAGAQVPLGPEFRVNTHRMGYLGSVAADAAGGFVVVWTSPDPDGYSSAIVGRRYDPSGAPKGPEFQVNTQTTGFRGLPRVASDPRGAFAVVWEGDQDGDRTGVFGRRYDAAGVAGPEFQVNTHTTGDQVRPVVAMDASGNFVVAWSSFGQEDDGGYGIGVYARRYDASGVPLAGEFNVNAYTTGWQLGPSVAMSASGSFLVVWNSFDMGLPISADVPSILRGQHFDPEGTRVGPELRLDAGTPFILFPSMAMGADGRFVVVGIGASYESDESDVVGRRYDNTGRPEGDVFQINTYTTGYSAYPSVSSDAAGNFVVAWHNNDNQDGDGLGVFARRYDAQGIPASGEFQLNAYTTGDQGYAQVAVDGIGNFVTVWSDYTDEGPVVNVYARRFRPDLIFRDGVESGTVAAWSASRTDGGDLTISPAAAMGQTTQGLQGFIDDRKGIFVEDHTPDGGSRYRARFYVDPNGFDPGEDQGHRRMRTLTAFSERPYRRVGSVVLRRLNGSYSVMAQAREDDGRQAYTGFFTVSDEPHAIEIDLVRASGPDALDGRFELWIDGISVSTLTGLDNSLGEVDFVRMGALSVKAGANGTIYWDEFESRRGTYIGPLP